MAIDPNAQSKSYAMTADQYQSSLTALGLPSSNSGTFNPPSHPEITLGYAYANGVLQVTILHDSWYETAGEVWDGIAPYLQGV